MFARTQNKYTNFIEPVIAYRLRFDGIGLFINISEYFLNYKLLNLVPHVKKVLAIKRFLLKHQMQ